MFRGDHLEPVEHLGATRLQTLLGYGHVDRPALERHDGLSGRDELAREQSAVTPVPISEVEHRAVQVAVAVVVDIEEDVRVLPPRGCLPVVQVDVAVGFRRDRVSRGPAAAAVHIAPR